MATRVELRAAARRMLEDESPTPLWDDATLNGFLAEAVRRYGVRVPAERTASVVVAAGDEEVPVAAGRVVRVIDPSGRVLARTEWRWWEGAVRLAAPAAAGAWRVEHLGGRELPDDDVAAVEIAPGDEEIVTLLACAAALRRRAIEDEKRGLARGAAGARGLAEALDAEAERMFVARLRRVRGRHADHS